MKRLLFAAGIALGSSTLFAQSSPERNAIPAVVLKTNMTTLVNIYKQSAMLSADFRIAPRASIDLGAGYFLSSLTFARRQEESYTGPRLRAGFKYYYELTPRHIWSIGAEAKYNYVTHRSWENYLRQGGQYQETLMRDRRVTSKGMAARWSGLFFLGPEKRIVLEPYLGLGYVAHRVEIRNVPPDAELLREFRLFIFEFPQGRSAGLDFLLGFHLGYALY